MQNNSQFRKSEYGYACTAFVVIVIDQITKRLAFAGNLNTVLNSLQPVFGVFLSANRNFAFSIYVPYVLGYAAYAIVLIAFIVWYVRGNPKQVSERIGFYLVLGGAASNIIDRFLFGYVRDFIAAFWGNIFNLADVAIVAGILIILTAGVMRSKNIEGI